MKKLMVISILALLISMNCRAGEQKLINNGWTFHLGETTESVSPSSPSYDDSWWYRISLPYDCAVDVPFDQFANTVGWYRHHFTLAEWEKGRNVAIRFDGISGRREVYCNGVLLGHGTEAFPTDVYDLTPYLNYGSDNLIAVKVSAGSTDNGLYEGAGVIGDVYLLKSSSVYVPESSTRIWTNFGKIYVSTKVVNKDYLVDDKVNVSVTFNILDADGGRVSTYTTEGVVINPFDSGDFDAELHISIPHMWELDDPYLYTLKIAVNRDGRVVDESETKFGVRDVVFDPNRGFVLNNRRVAFHGVNIRQDHAGVGAAIPKELWRYRLNKLKELGVNVVRCTYSPTSPAMLAVCDEIGMLVVDETGLTGVNRESLDAFRSMIERDFNHPSVILWSAGSDENISNGIKPGYNVIRHMTEYAKIIDPSRSVVYNGCSNDAVLGAADVNGYNFYRSSHAETDHAVHQFWKCMGGEEPSGAGTRGKYVADASRGWVVPTNRTGVDGICNIIGNAVNYYETHKWNAGMFFNSGFDYKGKTFVQDGILDYCGFRKDESYYLQACWTWVPVLHICGEVDGQIWVYSNCASVELVVNGKSLGRKNLPENGYLSWNVPAGSARKVVAKGVFKGNLPKPVNIQETYTPVPTETVTYFSKDGLKADGQDVLVVDITSRKDIVPVSVTGPVEILGWGNGDPSFKGSERPSAGSSQREIQLQTFSGKAQLILRSIEGQQGQVTMRVDGKDKPLFSY